MCDVRKKIEDLVGTIGMLQQRTIQKSQTIKKIQKSNSSSGHITIDENVWDSSYWKEKLWCFRIEAIQKMSDFWERNKGFSMFSNL